MTTTNLFPSSASERIESQAPPAPANSPACRSQGAAEHRMRAIPRQGPETSCDAPQNVGRRGGIANCKLQIANCKLESIQQTAGPLRLPWLKVNIAKRAECNATVRATDPQSTMQCLIGHCFSIFNFQFSICNLQSVFHRLRSKRAFCSFPDSASESNPAKLRFVFVALVVLLTLSATPSLAQAPAAKPNNAGEMVQRIAPPNVEDWVGPQRLSNTLVLFLVLTVLTLAPTIVIMTTSFVRIVIVLSITRQALGTQSLPPNSVLTTIALFMTFHIMNPVLTEMYQGAVQPYSQGKINDDELVAGLVRPMRQFMATQIEITHNHDDVWLFVDFSPNLDPDTIQTYDDVPLNVLLPAYLLSELRTAFMIGFQLFLPFLIIDMAISSILVSMGMMMLPPVLISLPFKLLLFVLVDGWTLIAEMLLTSFVPGSAGGLG